jgi:hypothetical protein
MGNMSYCRFENTLDDLRDCQQALYSIYEDVSEWIDPQTKQIWIIPIEIIRDFNNAYKED